VTGTELSDRRTDQHTQAPWWRRAVIYQVYVRSFADANGDGIGDLPGVRSKLPYLAGLGVDAIWLNPFYPSPQADAGYDVSNYRDVDPRFGTLADAENLIQDAHGRGIRVIVDLVPNHTSDRHVWFQAALAAAPGSPERDRYMFREGRGPGGDEPPNNWLSQFGGPAWTRVADGQWYLHLFAPEQPDLNWFNPEVVAEFKSILRFWLDRGADGFRIDVAHGLSKNPALPDVGEAYYDVSKHPSSLVGHPYWDVDGVHEIYQGWRQVLDSYPGERVFVAEAWVPDPKRLALYLRPDELQTAFNFDFLLAPWEAKAMREVIDATLDALRSENAPATWVLSNHDVVRHATRYGGGAIGQRRARAAILLTLSLPGGTYIYQGEELGLEEVTDIPDDRRQDPKFFRTHGAEPGRDGSRVPLPWSGSEPPFGFGTGAPPWLPQPEAWASRTVEAEDRDPASMLSLYRSALSTRHGEAALGDGPMTWVDATEDVLAFRRSDDLAVVVNFSDEPRPLPPELVAAEVLVASEPLGAADELPASGAVWLRTRPPRQPAR
jgi:alpha-glucosidase